MQSPTVQFKTRRPDGFRADGHYFPGMVREAIADARRTLGMTRDGDVRLA